MLQMHFFIIQILIFKVPIGPIDFRNLTLDNRVALFPRLYAFLHLF